LGEVEGGAGIGNGIGIGSVFGVDEVVEHLGEAAAASFFTIDGGGEFGDGGDGAVVGVEDNVFD
jgi:hypothetical protein